MPSLSLYFAPNFADLLWQNSTYKLEIANEDDRHNGEWVLGRSPTCEITISIRDISRKHLAINYSYAADQWSTQDLGSQEGTVLNGQRLKRGDQQPIAIGDRLWLASNLITIVEDEQDTVGKDNGPPTVASTQSLPFIPAPAPAPAPAPVATYADNIGFALQWLATPTTWIGGAVRFAVVAMVATVVVLVFG
jgi:predicted component of type VI protein secretion system